MKRVKVAKRSNYRVQTINQASDDMPTKNTVIVLKADGTPFGGYSSSETKSLATQHITQLAQGAVLQIDPRFTNGDLSYRIRQEGDGSYIVYPVREDNGEPDPTKQSYTCADFAALDALNVAQGEPVDSKTAAVTQQVVNAVNSGDAVAVAAEVLQAQAAAEQARSDVERMRSELEAARRALQQQVVDNSDAMSVGGSVNRGAGPSRYPRHEVVVPSRQQVSTVRPSVISNGGVTTGGGSMMRMRALDDALPVSRMAAHQLEWSDPDAKSFCTNKTVMSSKSFSVQTASKFLQDNCSETGAIAMCNCVQAALLSNYNAFGMDVEGGEKMISWLANNGHDAILSKQVLGTRFQEEAFNKEVLVPGGNKTDMSLSDVVASIWKPICELYYGKKSSEFDLIWEASKERTNIMPRLGMDCDDWRYGNVHCKEGVDNIVDSIRLIRGLRTPPPLSSGSRRR